MNGNRVIIIGAGMAGLSLGCYLQRNGYYTEIFEAHNVPGGLCTGWKRKGYNIEGCIHGLLGSSPSHPFYKLYNELVDMENIKFIDHDIKHVYNFSDGSQFIEYANLGRLEDYMLETAPEDSLVIREFISDIRKFQKVTMPVDKPREFFDITAIFTMVKAVPMLSVIKKWLKVTPEDFAMRFKNPLLQQAVKYFANPVLFEMFVLSAMDLKQCGYPAMGSLEFARLFEAKYLSIGGKINYRSRVEKILVSDSKVVGIRLINGEVHKTDLIVSAMDGRTTIFELLEGNYIDDTIRKAYENPDLNPSKLQISIGVNKAYKNIAATVKLILDKALQLVDGCQHTFIDVMTYKLTNEAGLQDRTLFVVQLDTKNGEYWNSLRKNDRIKYNGEKEKISREIIDLIDSRLAVIKGNIEMIDVATPATYMNYTQNWKGSIQGWSNENIFKANPFKRELPGLKNFYMTGQWVEPGGGVPTVYKSGRDLAQIICRRDGKKFKGC